MFAFGFGGIFIITQMHGLGLSKLIRSAIAFAVAVLLVYAQRGWPQINEVVRIPIIEYVCVLVLAGLIGLGVWMKRMLTQRRESSSGTLTSGK